MGYRFFSFGKMGQFCVLIFAAWLLARPNFCKSIENSTAKITFETARINYLRERREKAILIHVHIPKAGGTALSLALASECQCSADKSSCYLCQRVRGDSGYSYDYSISRVTGWPCKAHAPLVLMREAPCQGFKFSDKGLYPTFVVMLREPFDRFVSEAYDWCGVAGHCMDWAFDFEAESKHEARIYHHEYNFTNVLLSYANVPRDLIIHNRQIKMIGGDAEDFNHGRFYGQKRRNENRISVWNSQKLMVDVYRRALSILSTENDVLPLIHERFAESLCLLEYIYAGLYSFHWDPDSHSHGKGKTNTPIVQNLTALRETEIYKIWEKKNTEDLQLYQDALEIFDGLFKTVMDLFRAAKRQTGERLHMPHCHRFLTRNV